MNTNKRIISFTVGGFLLAVSVVIIYMWKNKFSIAETGTLGDGFNGLLAPFIAFGGAVLVYLSFKEQIKANKIITSQWEFDRNIEIFQDIKRTYENIEIKNNFGMGIETKKGADAIEQIIDFDITRLSEHLKYFKKLEYVLIELQFLIKRLKTSDIENQRYIWLKIDLFYEEQLQKNLDRFLVNYGKGLWGGGQLLDLHSEVQKFLKIYKERY